MASVAKAGEGDGERRRDPGFACLGAAPYRYHLVALYVLSGVQWCALAALCYACLDAGGPGAAGAGGGGANGHPVPSRTLGAGASRHAPDIGLVQARAYSAPATTTTTTATTTTATTTTQPLQPEDVSGDDDLRGQGDQPRFQGHHVQYLGGKTRSRRSSLDDRMTTTSEKPREREKKEEFVWLSSYSRITVRWR